MSTREHLTTRNLTRLSQQAFPFEDRHQRSGRAGHPALPSAPRDPPGFCSTLVAFALSLFTLPLDSAGCLRAHPRSDPHVQRSTRRASILTSRRGLGPCPPPPHPRSLASLRYVAMSTGPQQNDAPPDILVPSVPQWLATALIGERLLAGTMPSLPPSETLEADLFALRARSQDRAWRATRSP